MRITGRDFIKNIPTPSESTPVKDIKSSSDVKPDSKKTLAPKLNPVSLRSICPPFETPPARNPKRVNSTVSTPAHTQAIVNKNRGGNRVVSDLKRLGNAVIKNTRNIVEWAMDNTHDVLSVTPDQTSAVQTSVPTPPALGFASLGMPSDSTVVEVASEIQDLLNSVVPRIDFDPKQEFSNIGSVILTDITETGSGIKEITGYAVDNARSVSRSIATSVLTAAENASDALVANVVEAVALNSSFMSDPKAASISLRSLIPLYEALKRKTATPARQGNNPKIVLPVTPVQLNSTQPSIDKKLTETKLLVPSTPVEVEPSLSTDELVKLIKERTKGFVDVLVKTKTLLQDMHDKSGAQYYSNNFIYYAVDDADEKKYIDFVEQLTTMQEDLSSQLVQNDKKRAGQIQTITRQKNNIAKLRKRITAEILAWQQRELEDYQVALKKYNKGAATFRGHVLDKPTRFFPNQFKEKDLLNYSESELESIVEKINASQLTDYFKTYQQTIQMTNAFKANERRHFDPKILKQDFEQKFANLIADSNSLSERYRTSKNIVEQKSIEAYKKIQDDLDLLNSELSKETKPKDDNVKDLEKIYEKKVKEFKRLKSSVSSALQKRMEIPEIIASDQQEKNPMADGAQDLKHTIVESNTQKKMWSDEVLSSTQYAPAKEEKGIYSSVKLQKESSELEKEEENDYLEQDESNGNPFAEKIEQPKSQLCLWDEKRVLLDKQFMAVTNTYGLEINAESLAQGRPLEQEAKENVAERLASAVGFIYKIQCSTKEAIKLSSRIAKLDLESNKYQERLKREEKKLVAEKLASIETKKKIRKNLFDFLKEHTEKSDYWHDQIHWFWGSNAKVKGISVPTGIAQMNADLSKETKENEDVLKKLNKLGQIADASYHRGNGFFATRSKATSAFYNVVRELNNKEKDDLTTAYCEDVMTRIRRI